jgi:hypothetical protein
MHQNNITDEKLREASMLVSRHVGIEVIDAVVHGSVLRGFNDPNSDIDICFLVNRPVSDFINMSTSPFFDGSPEDKRKKANQLSATMSRELGWQIMVTLLDMRSMMRGIMSSSPFSLMAYESLSKPGSFVSQLFDEPARHYFNVSNLVNRCGEQVTTGMRNFVSIKESGAEYKQERTYLGTLWSAHRLLAYISGDRKHARTITELMTYNRANGWEGRIPAGFSSLAVGVLKARTERSPFDMPNGVSADAALALKTFVQDVLAEAAAYLRANPRQNPSASVETRELIDLYGALLDHEDDLVAKQRNVKEGNAAA